MAQQFPQATKNLLRALSCSYITCPRFAEENREAVQQFLSRFASHIINDMLCLGMNTELEKAYLEKVLAEIKDMPEEQNPLSSTLAHLQELLTWPENWNAYGASAPKPASVSRATTWITEAYQLLQQSWIQPHVGVNGDGEVEFDWRNGQRKLSVYFDEQNVEYLQVDGKGINAPMYDGDISSIDDMQRLWQWLTEAREVKEA